MDGDREPSSMVRENLLVAQNRLPALLVRTLPPSVEAMRLQELAKAFIILRIRVGGTRYLCVVVERPLARHQTRSL